MAKRVSVKGKGADIFFGDYTPAPPSDLTAPLATPEQVDNQPETPVAIEEASPTPAAKGARKKDDLHAREHARMQESKNESIQGGLPALEPSGTPFTDTLLDSIWDYVSAQATINNAFRYTNEELSWLTDAIYELGKRHGVKITKQDVARLGLNAVLWDYRSRGDRSLLAELALRRQRQRRGS